MESPISLTPLLDFQEAVMIRSLKLYFFDTIVNILAQVFILFAGCLSLRFGDFYFWGWIVIVIGYSFVLAKMGRFCEQRKDVPFKHYILGVMLPSNAVALAVSCFDCAVVLSMPKYMHINLMYGLLIFIGSAAITLISVFFNRVALR